MTDDAKSLTYCDALPLHWVPLSEAPDASSLERLGEANVNLLYKVVSLEERHRPVHEEGELEQEISRLHGKMDLLLGLMATLARERMQLPPSVDVRLSADMVTWPEACVRPSIGTRVMISIYLSPCIAEPLRLPAIIEQSAYEGSITVRIEHPSEACYLALEQHVFLHHRRSIAESRHSSRPKS